jgi:PAS domain-containing protein
VLLRGSQDRVKLVANAIGDVIWDWNLRSDTIWRSDGFENTFGLAASEEDELQTTWDVLIHPEGRDRMAGNLMAAGNRRRGAFRFTGLCKATPWQALCFVHHRGLCSSMSA